jgi:cell wall-associated NlpC family hydrolase
MIIFRRAAVAAAIILTAVLAVSVAAPAHAATAAPRASFPAGAGGSLAGNEALNWAERHATGHGYCFGGTGPSCWDCSGLVMTAFRYGAGIALPRTTYAMPGSPRLHRIPLADARRGDILFYGPGHVELDTVWRHVSFGAHDSGSRIGWISWGSWWAPTAAYRVF